MGPVWKLFLVNHIDLILGYVGPFRGCSMAILGAMITAEGVYPASNVFYTTHLAFIKHEPSGGSF